MRTWTKRDPVKNYFPLPNEIYQLGLSHSAIAVYGYLLRIEDRRTYQCHPSYATIGKAVGMSRNTVRKYVQELEERGLIRTERTSIITQDGRKQNGSLLYTILPIQFSIDQFYQRQMDAAKTIPFSVSFLITSRYSGLRSVFPSGTSVPSMSLTINFIINYVLHCFSDLFLPNTTLFYLVSTLFANPHDHFSKYLIILYFQSSAFYIKIV